MRALFVELAIAGEACERGCGDRFGAVLEMPAQMFAVFAAAESIGTERDEPAG